MYPNGWIPSSDVWVDDDFNSSTPGWGYDHFNKIQYGINGVQTNGTVYVYNGTYYENVVVNKKINLIGGDKNNTIIDGVGVGDVIHITANRVNISGFMIQHAGFFGWETDYDAGIDVRSDYNIITDNNFDFNPLHSIYLRYGSNNIVMQNAINNGYGGLYVAYSHNNRISKNIFTNVIHLALRLYDSDNNSVYHNNFLNNTELNAMDEAGGMNNTWDNGNPSGGNYWDDYLGVDEDGDGIGDTPYNISGGSNQDLYPFMQQNGWLNEPPNTPLIDGPSWGIVNVNYTFCVTLTAPDGDDLYCMWNWGDGNISEWFGPFSSGETICANHSWSQKGTYAVQVKLKDINGVEIYSDPHDFTVYELKRAFIFGIIVNLTTVDDTIMFEAVNIKVITFQPFSFVPYMSGEQFTILNNYKGFLGYRFIFALCYIPV